MTEMPGYAFWSGLSAACCGLLTYASVRLWDRRLRREEREAESQAEAVEAAARRQQEAEQQTLAEVARSERRYRALAEAGASAVWRTDAAGNIVAVQGWRSLTGQSDDGVLGSAQDWLRGVHPEDREAAASAWSNALRTGAPMQVEYRVRRPDGEDWQWCRSRGVAVRAEPEAAHPEGRIIEWIGVVYDIDAQRRAEAQWRLLAMEVNHRAKNTLAVVQTLVRMGGGADQQAADKLMARVRSLARAHDLLAQREWRSTDLRTVAELELKVFDEPSGHKAFRLSGPPVALAAFAVQSLTLVLHELATNAAKYGALAHHGSVDVSWAVEGDHLRLCWAETLPQAVATPPRSRGFGTRVIDTTIRAQLGGSIERQWQGTGLMCDIAVPLSRLQSRRPQRDVVPPPPLPSVADAPPAAMPPLPAPGLGPS